MRLSFTPLKSTALITGASAGLGAEFARQLAPKASRIILVGRREARLRALASELQPGAPHLRIDCFPADLSLATERQRLATWVIREQIPVNLLINNAGLGDLGSFDTAPWERIAPMLELNITALTHLTHLMLPMLKAQVAPHSSAILNVSSVAGFFPLPDLAVYAATKAYVTSFSEALRMELAPEGITVTALCPGPVPTEFLQVASRPGEITRTEDRSPSALHATAAEVVRDALRALEKNKPDVVPNRFLALLIRGALLLPFPIRRMVIRLGAGPRSSKAGKH